MEDNSQILALTLGASGASGILLSAAILVPGFPGLTGRWTSHLAWPGPVGGEICCPA